MGGRVNGVRLKRSRGRRAVAALPCGAEAVGGEALTPYHPACRSRLVATLTLPLP